MKTFFFLTCRKLLIFLVSFLALSTIVSAHIDSDPEVLLEKYLKTGSYTYAEQIKSAHPGSPYDRFCDAWEMVDLDGAQALELAELLVVDAPDFAPGHYLVGAIKLEGFHRYQEAISALDHCLALDPSFILAYEDRGIARLATKDFEASLSDFEKLLSYKRGYAKAYLLRGVANHGIGEQDALMADLEIGLQLDFKSLAPIYTTYAKAAIDQAIERAPENAIYLFARGYAYFSSGDYKEASEDFQRLIDMVPGSADFYKYSGASKMYLKDAEDGQKDLNFALSINPDDPQIYYFLAVLMNDYLDLSNRALEYMNHAIELDDEVAEYFYERAKASYTLMSLESARDDINRALLLNHREGDYYALRGQIKQKVGRPADDFCPDYRKAAEWGTSYNLKRILKRTCK